MPARTLLAIVIVAVCCWWSEGFAVASERSRYASTLVHGLAVSSRSTGTPKTPQRTSKLKPNSARTMGADRDPYADPASPYKANRLSWWPAEPILNVPGQTTVLTRQVLDDMNATSLKDALRSTAGVTVGR